MVETVETPRFVQVVHIIRAPRREYCCYYKYAKRSCIIDIFIIYIKVRYKIKIYAVLIILEYTSVNKLTIILHHRYLIQLYILIF